VRFGTEAEELLPLLSANVDLASRPETPNGAIHVRGEGKSDAAIRSVPLTPRALNVLTTTQEGGGGRDKTVTVRGRTELADSAAFADAIRW
jgi:hypothetical protein